jgi:uncharacterized membrane protein YedE/YeeE
MISEVATLPTTPRSPKLFVVLILALFSAGAFAIGIYGWRQSVLFLVGGLFGIALYHASFGFASAYRKLFVHGEVKGIIAQIWMLAIATILFTPVLAAGTLWGQDFRGALSPVAVSGAIGAFLFGIGMQLGSGCACGTLYTIGGGSSMMVITLLTFCAGSFWASLTGDLWSGLPRIPPVSLVQNWGYAGAIVQLLILGAIGYALWLRERRRPEIGRSNPLSWRTLLYGPWPLQFGAIFLAALNFLTLLIAGRPWGVTWGFTLWGAKIATLLGWNPATSDYWSQGAPAEALSNSVFADVVSVMNFGLVLGAALGAALAGRLAVKKPASRQAILAAVIGGLMMGYGARLAFGCNVGAYFSGIASTSLHGWLWIVFALLGTFIGVRARSLFRLSNG